MALHKYSMINSSSDFCSNPLLFCIKHLPGYRFSIFSRKMAFYCKLHGTVIAVVLYQPNFLPSFTAGEMDRSGT